MLYRVLPSLPYRVKTRVPSDRNTLEWRKHNTNSPVWRGVWDQSLL